MLIIIRHGYIHLDLGIYFNYENKFKKKIKVVYIYTYFLMYWCYLFSKYQTKLAMIALYNRCKTLKYYKQNTIQNIHWKLKASIKIHVFKNKYYNVKFTKFQ